MKKNNILILLTLLVFLLNQPLIAFAAPEQGLHCKVVKTAGEILAIQGNRIESVSLQNAITNDLKSNLTNAITKASAYLVKTVPSPQYGSIGGEWTVIGLARSGSDVPKDYYSRYCTAVEQYVKECGGVLHEKKYTEYSRLILALTAIGKDPRNVGGYNLLTPLGDYDQTVFQGLNGPVWALIALDSGNYDMPQNSTANVQATRQMYVDYILECQLDDGGWNLTSHGGSGTSDPDMTGMVLQALAKYTYQKNVTVAIDKALLYLSSLQGETGGFSSWGVESSESTAQVVVALCELGIDINDKRFVKNGNTLLDNLLSYQESDGSFLHIRSGSGSNLMATEQSFYALAAVLRAQTGKSSLYRMADSAL